MSGPAMGEMVFEGKEPVFWGVGFRIGGTVCGFTLEADTSIAAGNPMFG